MRTVIVGRASNLSAGLAEAIPDTMVLSARRLAGTDVASVLPCEPFRLVLNHFQPASHLSDLTSPTSYIELSLSLTARLLEGIVGLDCRKVLYTSTAAVYADNEVCREEDTPRAPNLHAALKLSNEHLIHAFCEGQGLDHTVVRLFNLYGGEDRFSIVARIIAAVRQRQPITLSNQGNAVRDFIHLRDVAASYRALLECRELPVINVATGTGTSVRTIVDAVRLRGHQLETTSDQRSEIQISTADVSRLSEIVDVGGFSRVVDYVLRELE